MMNAAPPFCPVVNGNLHILPSPTAEPAVASTSPILEPKFPLLSIFSLNDAYLIEEYKNHSQRTEIFGKEYVGVEQSATQSAPVGELFFHDLVWNIPAYEHAGEESADGQEYLSGDIVEYVEQRHTEELQSAPVGK